jgi:hypothetical protein
MTRKLNEKEMVLIKHLLHIAKDDRVSIKLPELIEVMQDGEMGSIQFGSRNGRSFGKDIVQVKYVDQDSIPVFITLIEDNHGALFELEFWKVNFSKLIEFPSPTQVEVLK